MKHLKGASQAPTQLVLPNLGILHDKQKKKDSWLFNKKKKIKKIKKKSRKLGHNTKGKKRSKKSKK